MGYRIALIGNPNCGKSTLFNALTGLNNTVGNRSGVTVDSTEGKLSEDLLIDLPGVYSLASTTPEERVALKGLLSSDFIINVLDGTNLLRGLHLTAELLKLGKQLIVAVNMIDELDDDELNLSALASLVGCPVVGISALNGKLDDLKKAVSQVDITLAEGRSPVKKIVEYTEIAANASLFSAGKPNKRSSVTEAIDKAVLNKYLAFPIFFVVMALVYGVSILLGGVGKEYMEKGFSALSGYAASALDASPAAESLLCAVISGVGSVLSFLPQVVLLFLFISLLEGCGYMARIAFIMDKLLSKIGLSGKSFIPVLVGASCTVPAVMAARTVEDIGERRLTVLLTPFVPCSAKLPVISLVCSSFFPYNPFVAPSLYFLSIAAVIVCGYILSKLEIIKKSGSTFLLDLPLYRCPQAKNVAADVFGKAKHFLLRAGTVIFALSILLWLLQSYSFAFKPAAVEGSMLASIGKSVAPLFAPLGFGRWETVVSLMTGAFAKESIVSTLALLTSSEKPLVALLSPVGAFSFLVFVLLCFPCVAALATIRSELGGKWLAAGMLFQFAVAYSASLIVNTLGMLVSCA